MKEKYSFDSKSFSPNLYSNYEDAEEPAVLNSEGFGFSEPKAEPKVFISRFDAELSEFTEALYSTHYSIYNYMNDIDDFMLDEKVEGYGCCDEDQLKKEPQVLSLSPESESMYLNSKLEHSQASETEGLMESNTLFGYKPYATSEFESPSSSCVTYDIMNHGMEPMTV